jgi:hypothetical protein
MIIKFYSNNFFKIQLKKNGSTVEQKQHSRKLSGFIFYEMKENNFVFPLGKGLHYMRNNAIWSYGDVLWCYKRHIELWYHELACQPPCLFFVLVGHVPYAYSPLAQYFAGPVVVFEGQHQ